MPDTSEEKSKVKEFFDGLIGLVILGVIVWFGGKWYFGSSSGNDPEALALAVAAEQRQTEECKRTIRCWGDKHVLSATYACQDQIQRLAQFGFEWTDGILEPKLSEFRWHDIGQHSVTYLGDTATAQNQFGARFNVVYECDFSPDSNAVLDARLFKGML